MSQEALSLVGHRSGGRSSSHDLSEFAYQQLQDDEIRLVRLFPGVQGTVINCEIFHFRSELNPEPYECVSYVWGDPAEPQSIIINGRTMQIRQNLRAALEAIRDTEKTRTLWIDALCINQDDIEELNAQVAKMGKIFHNATKVLAWLGQSADDSDILFDHIQPAKDWGYEWAGPWDLRTAEAMLAFYCRPYWRRVWVLQEILVARAIDLLCGNMSISMEKYRWGFGSFTETMEGRLRDGDCPPWFTERLRDKLEQSPGCIILRRQYGGETDKFSLLRLLETCASCNSQCELVHDKIYGIIGVLKSSQQGLIVPDYSKPLSQVFVDVLISLVVPDTAQDSHYVSMWGYIGRDLIDASRIIQNILEQPLWNKEVDTFYPVNEICSSAQLEKMAELRLEVWIEGVGAICEVSDSLTVEGFFEEDLLSLSQANDVQKDRFRTAAKNLAARDFHCTQEIGTQYMRNGPQSNKFSPTGGRDNEREIISRQSMGETRQFITKNGLLGLASSAIQKGDLLYGFNCLEGLFYSTVDLYLILRPLANHSADGFTLIGRATMLLAVPPEKFSDIRDREKQGKYANFGFEDDVAAEGINIDCKALKEIDCDMDGITLLMLTR